jgi:hypothetical protein
MDRFFSRLRIGEKIGLGFVVIGLLFVGVAGTTIRRWLLCSATTANSRFLKCEIAGAGDRDRTGGRT